MNDSNVTYVATCHPFIVTDSMLKRRRLARQAKSRRDPGSAVIMTGLVNEILSAILGFEPAGGLDLAAWVGAADRLAHLHPSGLLEHLGGETSPETVGPGGIEFATAVGPRSYWPVEEARIYRTAVGAFTQGGASIEDVAHAAKSIVAAAHRREASWSRDEWHYRITAAIAGWIYWDDEPGSRREA